MATNNAQGGSFPRPDRMRETEIGNQTFDFSNLQEFIDNMKKGEEEVARLRHKLDEDYARQIKRENEASAKELANLKNVWEKAGIQLSQVQQEKFLKDYYKKKKYYEEKELKETWNRQRDDMITYWKEWSIQSIKAEKETERKRKKEEEVYKTVANLRQAGGKDNEKLAKQIEKSYLSMEDFRDDFKDNFAELIKETERGSGDVWAKDLINTMKGVGQAIEQGLNEINQAISTYASYQTGINARLQGVGTFSESVKTLSSVAYSPLIKTETLYENLNELISEGIASNVEQRAFLQTVSDGIATTFDANQSALKRLIKLQQYDTTASRLGMEAYLTKFLNSFVENTEYLSTSFDNVSDSLLEASSLMNVSTSTEFEYQVQKWLGVLSGLGMSDTTVQSIGQAVGYLGSGNISALNSSSLQQLLVMASNTANLDYGTLLSNGLTGDDVSSLMAGLVITLQGLGNSGSNVVTSSLANAFGVSASDIVSARNLSTTDLQNLLDNSLTYEGTYEELEYQMGQLATREGISNILENLFANGTFSTGMNIASNPALYALWKVTDQIQGVTGGINIPYVSAVGNGIDLNTTVENLMKLTIVGTSTLGNIGNIISGLASLGDGSSMLDSLGITSSADSNVLSRGSGVGSRISGKTTSLTTMIGNTYGADYEEGTLLSATEESQEELDQKVAEEKTIIEYLDEMEFENKLEELISNTYKIEQALKGTIKVENQLVSTTGLS